MRQPGQVLRLGITMRRSRKALLLITGFALITGAAACIYAAPWHDWDWRSLLAWIASAACFGVLLGGIYAFDAKSDLNVQPSSVGRATSGAAASLLLALIWQWPYAYWTLACLVGALLGYLGMAWAKYVDF